MSLAKTASPATMPRLPWLHIFIIALLMVSRRPDAILHPQFWAEDGQVFYHDAYTYGLPALWQPLGGYLNTLSRLVAAFTVNFPLTWAPAIYVAFAAFFQLLPVAIILSSRMDAALPSWPTRLALAYFYAAMPNSYELNLNLTNAQWHLAMAAFLILNTTPPARRLTQITDLSLLALSGLSGPFGIFLAPIAWFDAWRNRGGIAKAVVVSLTAAVQLALILIGHAASARLATPLGATPLGFIKIVTYQIVLGGVIGYRATYLLRLAAIWNNPAFLAVFALGAATVFVIALRIGPYIFRTGAFWAACLFGAALITPLSSTKLSQWSEMTHPGATIRYFAVPILLWFSTWLIIATSPWRALRCTGYIVLALAGMGMKFDWPYPPFHPTDFFPKANMFDSAPEGTVAMFQENPPGWTMTLAKK